MAKISKLMSLAGLPAKTWSGEEREWKGRPILHAEQGDLPVAYFRDQLLSMDCEIHYESPLFGKPNTLIRVPCVILGGDSDLISGLGGSLRERFDALPVIHASLPPIGIIRDGDGVRRGDFMFALPTFPDEDNPGDGISYEPEDYRGGRVYVILGVANGPGNYYELEYSGGTPLRLTLNACPGVENEDCDGYELEYPDILVDGTYHFFKQPWSGDENTDAADFARHLERFDRLKVAVGFEVEYQAFYDGPFCAGKVDDACAPILIDGEPYFLTDNAEEIELRRAKWLEIWSMLPPENRLLSPAGPIPNSTLIEDALALFES